MSNGIRHNVPPPLVALASWVVPGAGYVLIGHVARGVTIGATILVLFVLGLLMADIRVIDVPGYDDSGQRVLVETVQGKPPVPVKTWALRVRPVQEIFAKPWFIPQVLTGPICLISAKYSLLAAEPTNPGSIYPKVPRSHARVAEIGTLYTAVAGMLNLLAMIDAAHRAGQGGA